jgi:DNA polymerase-3 subunit epsilon
MARDLHPGQKNSLDALCSRYSIDNSRRTLHGALLDAQLLADVWIAMTRGQESLEIAMSVAPALLLPEHAAPSQVLLTVVRPDPEELAAHAALCERIEKESKGRCLWLHLPQAA